jgi:uncharacterized membrane protein
MIYCRGQASVLSKSTEVPVDGVSPVSAVADGEDVACCAADAAPRPTGCQPRHACPTPRTTSAFGSPCPRPRSEAGIMTVIDASRSTRPPNNRPTTGKRIAWGWVMLLSLTIVGYTFYTYTAGSLDTLAENDSGLASTYNERPAAVQVAFYMHITFSAVALALGPVQFIRALQRRRPSVHRWIGRVFMVSVALGAVASFIMAFFNSEQINGFFGFGSLAVLWGYTAWKGWRTARTGDYLSHQAWMIRCFALTFAGVTLRVWLGVLVGIQLPFTNADGDAIMEIAYAPLPFLCWVPNLVIAELMVRRRGLPALWMSPSRMAPKAAAMTPTSPGGPR